MNEKRANTLHLSLDPALIRPSEKTSRLEREITALFGKLRQPVYRFVISILKSPTEAEDITQEAFLRLYTALRRGEKIQSVPAWVFRTAHNLAIDRCRQESRLERMDPAELAQLPGNTVSSGPGVEQNMLKQQRAQALELALKVLSPQEQRCLALRAEGLRYREIAEVLNVGISTVETFLARAVRKLSREINV